MNAPTTAAALQNSAPEFLNVPLVKIKLSTAPVQIIRRARFGDVELTQMADDIKAHGVMQPVLLRYLDPPQGGLEYEMIAGERRYLASRMAGKSEVPALVRAIPEDFAEEMQIAENIQRKSYHPLEEAEGYQRLCQIHKCSAKDLVARVNQNEAHIYARLKLLKLCPLVKVEFYAGKLIPSIALEIARIPDDKMQQQAAKGCITGEDTGEFYRDGTGPLLYEQAKEYIETEFMIRIDGNREIAQWRKDKKTAIDGDEATKLWKNASEPPAGYELLDGFYWVDGARKNYCEVLSANMPGVVLVQSPFTGEAKRCLPRDLVIEAFKAKKVKLPNHMKQRELPLEKAPSAPAQSDAKPVAGLPEKWPFGTAPAGAQTGKAQTTTPAAEKVRAAAAALETQQEREQREAQLPMEIRLATFKAVRARYPKKFGKPELLLLLKFFFDPDDYPSIVQFPKDPTKSQERELTAMILDCLYAFELDLPQYDDTALMTACKRYSVNAAKIKADMTAAFKKKEAEITRASAAPVSKPKAVKVKGAAGASANKPVAKKKASKK